MNKEIDFDKLLEYSTELVDYEGVLPLLVRAVIITEWSRNLNRKGLWLDINKECVDTKPKTYDDAVKELVDWVKDNPKYKDMIT